MTKWICAAIITVVFCLAGCKAPAVKAGKAPKGKPAATPDSADDVVARVGDTLITEEMVQEKLDAMPPQIMGRFQSASGKRNLVQSMADLEVLYKEARRQGLDNDKETMERLQEYRKKLAADKLRENVVESVKVSDAEVKEEFQQKKERYTIPKRVRVSQIYLGWDKNASAQDIAAVEKNAREILDRAKKGEDFAELAKRYSLDQASAKKGGDIGYAGKRNMPVEVYTAAMALEKEGDITPLIKGREDIRILEATEVEPAKTKSLEEVRPWLERSIQSRKQREAWLSYMDDLKKKYNVVIYGDKLLPPKSQGPEAGNSGKRPVAGMPDMPQ